MFGYVFFPKMIRHKNLLYDDDHSSKFYFRNLLDVPQIRNPYHHFEPYSGKLSTSAEWDKLGPNVKAYCGQQGFGDSPGSSDPGCFWITWGDFRQIVYSTLFSEFPLKSFNAGKTRTVGMVEHQAPTGTVGGWGPRGGPAPPAALLGAEMGDESAWYGVDQGATRSPSLRQVVAPSALRGGGASPRARTAQLQYGGSSPSGGPSNPRRAPAPPAGYNYAPAPQLRLPRLAAAGDGGPPHSRSTWSQQPFDCAPTAPPRPRSPPRGGPPPGGSSGMSPKSRQIARDQAALAATSPFAAAPSGHTPFAGYSAGVTAPRTRFLAQLPPWMQDALQRTRLALYPPGCTLRAEEKQRVFETLCRAKFRQYGIDQLRFQAVVSKSNPELGEAELDVLWRLCDQDGDEFLSFQEFAQLF